MFGRPAYTDDRRPLRRPGFPLHDLHFTCDRELLNHVRFLPFLSLNYEKYHKIYMQKNL